jgi:acetyl-CoA carboxylase biotin carboxyl carrier protein
MAKSNSEIKERVKALYDIMISENLDELEIDSKEYSVCIKRKGSDDNKSNLQSFINPPAEKISVIGKTKDEIVKSVPEEKGDTIKSPITGIFYRSAAPSTPPFVSEGDIIDIGKTLCIIEAMKVMNEVKALFKVKIVKILVENSKPVSSEQDLFKIEKV